MTVEVLKAADELATHNVHAEVIDLATVSPIDFDTILESVTKTGRLVIVHEAARNCGVGAEIAATVAELAHYELEAPIQRVTGYDVIVPLARLEHDYIPSVARILDAVRATLTA
jgi:pyruvate dehydrogenase E1 component beta subunit